MASRGLELDTSAARAGDSDRYMPKAFLVGGGIASMAAAAFMIRDGDIPGHAITILEDLSRLGGSLDGSGSAQSGYVLPAGVCWNANTSARSISSHPYPVLMEAGPLRRKSLRGMRR